MQPTGSVDRAVTILARIGAFTLVGCWLTIRLLKGDRIMFFDFIRRLDEQIMAWLEERLPGRVWRFFSHQAGSVAAHGLIVFLFVAVGRLIALIGAPLVGSLVGCVAALYYLLREWEQVARERGPVWDHVTDWLGALAGAVAGFWWLF